MADSKISALSDGGAVQSTDEFVIERAGANYRVAGSALPAGVGTINNVTSNDGSVTITHPTGPTTDLSVPNLASQAVFNVLSYGATADGWQVSDANITSGSSTLTTTSSTPFTAGMVGKPISVSGAGTGNGGLTTTIASYVSSSHVTLNATAGTSVTNGVAAGGSNNTTAFRNAEAAVAAAGGGTILIPNSGTGKYYCVHVTTTSGAGFPTITEGTNNTTWQGSGMPTILTPFGNGNYRTLSFYTGSVYATGNVLSNIRVTGLQFNGSWPNLIYGAVVGTIGVGEADHYAIVFGGTGTITNFRVDNCVFQGFGSKCVEVRPTLAQFLTIDNNYFYNSVGNQIELKLANNGVIRGNFHYLCGNYGVQAVIIGNQPSDESQNILYEGNKMYDNGLICSSYGKNIQIVNNSLIQYGPTLKIGGAFSFGWEHDVDWNDPTSSNSFLFKNNYVDVSQASPPVYTGSNASQAINIAACDNIEISGNTLITDPMSQIGVGAGNGVCVGIGIYPSANATQGFLTQGLRIINNRVIGGYINVGPVSGGWANTGIMRNTIIANNIVDGPIRTFDHVGGSGANNSCLQNVLVAGNTVQANLAGSTASVTANVFNGTNVQVRDNIGYNPFGPVTTPVVPATGLETVNIFHSRASVYVSGTLTSIKLGLATPGNTGLTYSTTGGSLAGSTTYAYRVSARDSGNRETLASGENTIAVPAGTSTNKVTITWAAVPGANTYKVYGRTAGAELLLAAVSGATTTYVDDGSVTPSGALPASNATGFYDTGLTSGLVNVEPGMAIFLNYSGATPTWVWEVS